MEELVDTWIVATERSRLEPGRAADNWAIQEVLDMHLRDDHEEIWKIILSITSATDSEWVLDCLGAGPLEDLLIKHAPEYIERISIEAGASPKFKRALASVWLDENDTPLYKSIYSIAGVEPPFD